MNETEVSIPKHIGYIIDGNRRWAKSHGLPAYEGHLAGYESVKEVIFASFDAGIEFVSVYIFSTENWKRSQDEVGRLMKLALKIFTSDLKQFIDRGIRIKVLGTNEGISDALIDAKARAEERTKDLTSGTLCICFNYGGHREIVDAVRAITAEGMAPEAINEDVVAQHLYVPEAPMMDVVVRTSGEKRMSNFMLWRAAYSEFIFLDKLWPDMHTDDVPRILEEYTKRQRRFGGN